MAVYKTVSADYNSIIFLKTTMNIDPQLISHEEGYVTPLYITRRLCNYFLIDLLRWALELIAGLLFLHEEHGRRKHCVNNPIILREDKAGLSLLLAVSFDSALAPYLDIILSAIAVKPCWFRRDAQRLKVEWRNQVAIKYSFPLGNSRNCYWSNHSIYDVVSAYHLGD